MFLFFIVIASIVFRNTEFRKRFPAIYTNFVTRNGLKIREKRDSIPNVHTLEERSVGPTVENHSHSLEMIEGSVERRVAENVPQTSP